MRGLQRSHSTSLPLVLCLIALTSVTCARRGQQVFTQDPILAFGHGTFLGADGRPITPDRPFIESAQRYYVSSLEAQAQGRETIAVDRARRFIRNLVTDEIVANAIYIEWLLDNVRPDNAANWKQINGGLPGTTSRIWIPGNPHSTS